MLQAKLFGTPSFTLHTKPLDPGLTGRRLALFAYLLTQDEPCSRQTLLELLWSGIDESQAKEYLRGILYGVRQIVGNYLLVSRYEIVFNRHIPYWINAEVLSNHFSFAQTTFDPDLRHEVLSIYKGEFLGGVYVRDAPVFETWLESQRQDWHQRVVQGWQQLTTYYLTQAQYPKGLEATRELLSLEPWHEEAHRQQMIMLAYTGQPSAALAQYEHCCKILREEVDAPPSQETTLLYEQIKAGQIKFGSYAAIPNVPILSLPFQVVSTGDDTNRGSTNGDNINRASTNGKIINGYATNGYRATYPNGEAPIQNKMDAQDSALSQTLAQELVQKEERPVIAVDWGSMPREQHFYGRQEELHTLCQWVLREQCRVIAILGTGGQGKTTLAAQFVQKLSQQDPTPPTFERIIWISLLSAPPLDDILQDWLQRLSDQQVFDLPRTLDQKFTLLDHYLQRRRFLLVLDNVESILQEDGSGLCRAGYEAYGQLWQLFAQHNHQSCLLLTSRERPRELGHQEEQVHCLHTLLLDGLSETDGRQLLRAYGITGNEAILTNLLQCYAGHPLALKLAADVIDELFGGDVAAFLQEETPFFDDIGIVLEQQFTRLSPLEQELLTWLAVEQEPVTSQTLYDNLVFPPSKREYLTALCRLVRRSLVQPNGESFGLQNVILEYTRDRLINQLYQELSQEAIGILPAHAWDAFALSAFNRYALLKAHCKEYVRIAQERQVLIPLLKRLVVQYGNREEVDAILQRMLFGLRHLVHHTEHHTIQAPTPWTNGYVASNLLHLFLQIKREQLKTEMNSGTQPELSGYDFSQLPLRQAYLRQCALHSINFSGVHLQDCLFADRFGAVTALVFDPSGQHFITASITGEIACWQLSDGQLMGCIAGHNQMIFGLAISPDGMTLASSGIDQAIHIWDRQIGDRQSACLRYTLKEEVNFVRSLTFSPNGQWLAVAGGDGTVKLYTAASGQLCHTLPSPSQWLYSVAFSPSGNLLAAGSVEGAIYLWSLPELSQIATNPDDCLPHHCLEGHHGSVDSLVFSHDEQMLFSGGRDYLIHIWHLDHGLEHGLEHGVDNLADTQPSLCSTLQGHTYLVHTLALSPNGQLLASASFDHTVRLWHVKSGKLLDTLAAHEQRVWAVAFQPRPPPGQQILVSAGGDQRVLIWEIDAQSNEGVARLRQGLQGYSDAVRALAFSSDGQTLISGGFDRQIHLRHWQTERVVHRLRGHTDSIFAIAVSPNGQSMASSGYDSRIYLWSRCPSTSCSSRHGSEANTGGEDQPFASLTANNTVATGLAFSPDGKILASCHLDGTIRLWDAETQQLLQTLTGHTSWVWSIAFHPTRQQLASASFDQSVRLWDVGNLPGNNIQRNKEQESRLLQIFNGHTSFVWGVAFTPDGQSILSCSSDHTVRLWDCASQAASQSSSQKHRVLQGHTNLVRSLAVSPQPVHGCFTAAGADDDCTIRIWDLQNGRTIHQLQGHEGFVHSLTYHPDGKTLASACEQGDIRLWDLQTGRCFKVFRNLRPYTHLNITGVTGITPAQKAVLLALGAVEEVRG